MLRSNFTLVTFYALTFTSVSLGLMCSNVSANESYNLFHPTPKDEMREFSTDRPDKTESAYTVDAGHFQHETDILNYIQNSDAGSTTKSLMMMAPNLKVGLTHSTDIEFVTQSFIYEKSNNPSEKRSGYGDTIIRLKQNIWGNDDGKTALAIMPYVKIPTNHGDLGNNKTEGGLIIPIAINFISDFPIALMSQLDYLRKNEDSGNFIQLVHTASIGTNIYGPLSGYFEIFSAASNQSGHQFTVDSGLTLEVAEDCVFDIGVNIGTTDSADDVNPFLGLSQRF